MKRIWIGLLYMLLLVVFPAQIARANPHLPEQVFIVGLADGDGHGHESEDDAHTDDEDDHGDDEDHHAGDEDNHHANDGNGHSHDDGHHDEPFSITSLTPLFAGIGVGAVVSGVAHNRFRNALDGKHLAVIALTCITGTLHLLLGLRGDTLLLLNGIGFFALLALLYAPIGLSPQVKNITRMVLIAYTVVTIAGYIYLHTIEQYDALAILTKAVEVALVVILALQIKEVNNEVA